MMSKLKTQVKLLLGVIGRLPVVGTCLQHPAARRLLARIPGSTFLYVGFLRVHPFDRACGTDTSGFDLPVDVMASDSIRAAANAYLGSQPNVIRLALAQLPPLDSFTFLDLGCGKGRPLFVASEFPFRDIVGVELSPNLADIARRNAAIIAGRFPQRTAVRVVAADASTFPLPPGDLVIFLYHPFGLEPMARVAAQVNAALADEGRSIFIVYYNPVLGRCFDESPLLVRRFAGVLAYGEGEKGYGLDRVEDPVVIWQGGAAASLPTTALQAQRKIVVTDNGFGVELVDR